MRKSVLLFLYVLLAGTMCAFAEIEVKDDKTITIDTLSFSAQATTPVYLNQLTDSSLNDSGSWRDAIRYKNAAGETNETNYSVEGTLGLSFNPFDNMRASAVLKAWSAEPWSRLRAHWSNYYGDTTTGQNLSDNKKYVDLYAASFSYDADSFGLNGYYHTPHGSFEGKGDVFNISQEAYDVEGYAHDGSKAPIAVEFVGKGTLDGLTLIGGPEIWNGAAPQVMAHYYKSNKLSNGTFAFGLLYAQEFASSDNVNIDPYNGFGSGRKASVYGEFSLPILTAKLGILHAGSEKLDAKWHDVKGDVHKIELKDTLGAYVQLGTGIVSNSYIYANFIYRGLVADTNAAVGRGGLDSMDSGKGNRMEAQLGADMTFGAISLRPVVKARTPIQAPATRSLIGGSPFIVDLGNRRALEFEAAVTYDPEARSYFYNWNNDDEEGANIAFSIHGTYTLFAGKTDLLPYKSSNVATVKNNALVTRTEYLWYDAAPLPEQKNLWQIGGKIISNPSPELRLIGTVFFGELGSTTGLFEDTTERVTFSDFGLAARWRRFIGGVDVAIGKWGPENWFRDFNLTFPLQYSLDFAYSFDDRPSFLNTNNRIGVKLTGRHFGEYSADTYNALPVGAKMDGSKYWEITTYINIGL